MDEGEAWVALDPAAPDTWRACTVVGHSADGNVEVQTTHGERATLSPKCIMVKNHVEQDLTPDLAQLVHLSEPNLLHTLACRYAAGHIYTYTGTILIALNPWRDLSLLYGLSELVRYREQPLGVLPPHLFALADTAFRGVQLESEDQTILVSGESGAGKTESTKRLLEYLVAVSSPPEALEKLANATAPERRSPLSPLRSPSRTPPLSPGAMPSAGTGGLLQRKLLQSNPLLETFGNAQTLRNDNSSRFGKFIQVFFDADGRISGGAVRTYLLEKSRVVTQGKGERNYHIFYQAPRAATPHALADAPRTRALTPPRPRAPAPSWPHVHAPPRHPGSTHPCAHLHFSSPRSC